MGNEVKVRDLMVARLRLVHNTRTQLYKNIAYLIASLLFLTLLASGNATVAIWGGGILLAGMVLLLGLPKWTFWDDYQTELVPDSFLKEVEESNVPSELKGLIAVAYAEAQDLMFRDVLEIECRYEIAEKRQTGTGFQSLSKHIKRTD